MPSDTNVAEAVDQGLAEQLDRSVSAMQDQMESRLFGGDSSAGADKTNSKPEPKQRNEKPAAKSASNDEEEEEDLGIDLDNVDVDGVMRDAAGPDEESGDADDDADEEDAQADESDAEEETEDDEDEDEDEKGEWSKEIKDAFADQKSRSKEKLDKAYAKVEASETELVTLRSAAQEVEQLRAQVANGIAPAPMPHVPLANVFSEVDLGEVARKTGEEIKGCRRALRDLDRGDVESVYERVKKVAPDIEEDSDQLRDFLETWIDDQEERRDAIPERREWLGKQNQSGRTAQILVPESADPEFQKELNRVLTNAPWIKLSSAYQVQAAAQVLGLRELNRRISTRGKGVKGRKPAAEGRKSSRTPKPSASPGRPGRSARKVARSSGSSRRAAVSGGLESDLAAAIHDRL